MTFSSIIVTTLCIFCNVDWAFSQSHEALVVIKNSSSPSGISLPNKAKEFEGQIIYPEKDEDGSKIEYLYLCPPQSSDVIRDVKKLSENDPELKFCLEENPSIDTPKECPAEVKPTLTKHRKYSQQSETQCGKSPDHLTYNFGFRYLRLVKDAPTDIPDLRRRITTLSLYDICFDTKELKTLWTKHRLETASILKDYQEQGLPSQKIQFPYQFSAKSYALPKKTFLNMVNEYKAQDEDDYKMVPQMLVPEEDLALKIWKKTTTHMVNTAFLWKKLFPLMKAINDGIRKAAIAVSVKTLNPDTHQSDALYIYTIASPYILQKELYYDTYNKPDISDLVPFGLNIWCKFIHNETKNTGVMIYLHNLPSLPPTTVDTSSVENLDISPEKTNVVSDKIDTTSAKIDNTPKKINTLPEKISITPEKINITPEKNNMTPEKNNITPEETDTKSKDLKSDQDTDALLGKAECETPVTCDFRNWSNTPADLSDDILEYAYCCEVSNKKVYELFNIKINKKLELFDINRILNEKSI